MIIQKYNRPTRRSQAAATVAASSSSSQGGGSTQLSPNLDRRLWGNHDDGGDIDSTTHTNGSVYAHKANYNYENDENAARPEYKDRPGDTGGGVYAETEVEGPVVRATEKVFFPYPSDTDTPQDLAPLIKGIASSAASAASSASSALATANSAAATANSALTATQSLAQRVTGLEGAQNAPQAALISLEDVQGMEFQTAYDLCRLAQGKPLRLTVTEKGVAIGTLDMFFSDSTFHSMTQLLTVHNTIQGDGSINGASHYDLAPFSYFRTMRVTGSQGPMLEWTDWQTLGVSDLSDDIVNPELRLVNAGAVMDALRQRDVTISSLSAEVNRLKAVEVSAWSELLAIVQTHPLDYASPRALKVGSSDVGTVRALVRGSDIVLLVESLLLIAEDGTITQDSGDAIITYSRRLRAGRWSTWFPIAAM